MVMLNVVLLKREWWRGNGEFNPPASAEVIGDTLCDMLGGNVALANDQLALSTEDGKCSYHFEEEIYTTFAEDSVIANVESECVVKYKFN